MEKVIAAIIMIALIVLFGAQAVKDGYELLTGEPYEQRKKKGTEDSTR